jgi:Lon protease-like protein
LIVARPRKLSKRLLPHLERLPIFPLHRVQLFPRALLPLYIFEQRYRDMTAACLSRGGMMAVASLLPGFRADYHGRPPVRPVAGIGRIVAHRRNDDGTYNILLVGQARVRIIEELPPDHSFREVRARHLLDRWPKSYDPEEGRTTLGALAKRLAVLLPQGGSALLSLSEIARTTGELADVLTAVLINEPRLRLRLLNTTDVSVRTDLVADAMARLIADLQRPSDSEPN